MWEIEVVGDVGEIYRLLKDEFRDKQVTMTPYEFEVKARSGEMQTFTKNRAETVEGVSEQFRPMLKAVQSLLSAYQGTIKVTMSGEPGKGSSITIEVA